MLDQVIGVSGQLVVVWTGNAFTLGRKTLMSCEAQCQSANPAT